jgi:hypothetical protein
MSGGVAPVPKRGKTGTQTVSDFLITVLLTDLARSGGR